MKSQPSRDLDQRLSRLYAAPVPESFETGWRADIRREESIHRMKNWNGRPMWKRLAPAVCALVLAAGGLWTGTLDDMPESEGSLAFSRSASNTVSAKYSMTSEAAAYDSAPAYDTGITTYGAVAQTQRKLVRSAEMTIRTNAFEESLSKAQNQLETLGGYIENLYQYGENERRITLDMRVPSEKLDEYLLSLSAAGKVTNRSESTVDMTTQYYDNQARLDTLYQKRDRLSELLAQAQDVSDLIEIESAIADTQYQIDSYETSQRSIDREVDMSAVHLTLMERWEVS